jgi:hypothetical protein
LRKKYWSVDYRIHNNKYECIVQIIFYQHVNFQIQQILVKDATNTCERCNKKEKILGCNRYLWPETITVYTLIYLFCCALYKYLLNLTICMLIEDDINYLFIFIIIIFINYLKYIFNVGIWEHLTRWEHMIFFCLYRLH